MRRLRPHQPLTEAYEATGPLGSAQRSSGSWTNQQEHLIGWLSGYGGPGVYGRAGISTDAADVYKRFQCAPGLLWLAEALGEDQQVIIDAITDVKNSLHAAQASALRSAAASHGSASRTSQPKQPVHPGRTRSGGAESATPILLLDHPHAIAQMRWTAASCPLAEARRRRHASRACPESELAPVRRPGRNTGHDCVQR